MGTDVLAQHAVGNISHKQLVEFLQAYFSVGSVFRIVDNYLLLLLGCRPLLGLRID